MARSKRTVIRCLVLCLLVLAMASCMSDAQKRDAYDSVVITDPDLSTKADGDYEGEYTIRPPLGVVVVQKHVKVRVSVKTGRYEDIVVTRPSTLVSGEHIAELKERILAEQSLQVDATSGATSWTGKAYLKAIETALD